MSGNPIKNSSVQQALFNDPQRTRLSVTCAHIDSLLKDLEAILNAASSKSPFPKYCSDLNVTQQRVIDDYISRFRSQLLRVLDGVGILVPPARISALHAMRTNLTFIDIAVEELKPRYMRGYGELGASSQEMLNGIVAELDGLVRQLNDYLTSGIGQDFDTRLKQLESLGSIDVSGLSTIEQIISRHGLVEFRPALATILDRMEDQTFEIAVFGRVSSGKSSLLNRILETDILPVGVTPITAVPTRIRIGAANQLAVTFAGFGTHLVDIARISEFATEQQNPANFKHIAKLVVSLTSTKLREGITFVDTPGLGSLAAAGAAETMAYLPRCDFAIVLIDAGTTLTADDLQLLRRLHDVGITSSILLSKADLVTESERSHLIHYIECQVANELGFTTTVCAVSATPEHQRLVQTWYQNQLIPLFDNADQLRMQSVQRKIGSLRASLQSSLRSMHQRKDGEGTFPIAEEEEKLRRFSGRFVQLKKDSLAIVDQIDRSAELIVKEAVKRAWRFRRDRDFNARIRNEIEALTNDFASAIIIRITEFIPDIVRQLTKTAEVLSATSHPQKQDFISIASEVPRFEAPAIPVAVPVPMLASVLGDSFGQAAVVKGVNRIIAYALHSGLSYYRTMMRDWVESTFTRLQDGFDLFAEPYRAAIRRELGLERNNAPDQIEADLKHIQQLTASAT